MIAKIKIIFTTSIYNLQKNDNNTNFIVKITNDWVLFSTLRLP